MNYTIGLISIALTSIFFNNILLGQFLGMCSFLECSKNIKTAWGLGIAVTLVLAITSPLNWLLYTFVLKEGALSWVGQGAVNLDFLKFLSFIAVIAASVQILEMAMEKFTPPLYSALGIFLPLITVNCAILGVALFFVEKKYDFTQTMVYSVASGLGWFLAIMGLSAIKRKMKYSNVPAGLQGMGITFITAGLMSMAFMCFAGIDLSK